MLSLNKKNKNQTSLPSSLAEKEEPFRGEGQPMDGGVSDRRNVNVKARVDNLLAPFDEDAMDAAAAGNDNRPKTPVAILSCGDRFELLPTTTLMPPSASGPDAGAQNQMSSNKEKKDDIAAGKDQDLNSRAPPGLVVADAKASSVQRRYHSTPLYKRVMETKFRKAAIHAASKTNATTSNDKALSSLKRAPPSTSPPVSPPPPPPPSSTLRQRLAAASKKKIHKLPRLVQDTTAKAAVRVLGGGPVEPPQPARTLSSRTLQRRSQKTRRNSKKKKRLVAGKRVDFVDTPSSKARRLAPCVEESSDDEQEEKEDKEDKEHFHRSRSLSSLPQRKVSFRDHVDEYILDDRNSIYDDEANANQKTNQLQSSSNEQQQPQQQPWDAFASWINNNNNQGQETPTATNFAFPEWLGGVGNTSTAHKNSSSSSSDSSSSGSSKSTTSSDETNTSMIPLAPDDHMCFPPADALFFQQWFLGGMGDDNDNNAASSKSTHAWDASSMTAVAPVF